MDKQHIFVSRKIFGELSEMNLPLEERFVFLYLCQNSAVQLSGVYALDVRQISLDTDIPRNRMPEILENLAKIGLIFIERGVLFVPQIPRNARFGIANKVRYWKRILQSAIETVAALPSESALTQAFFTFFADAIEEIFVQERLLPSDEGENDEEQTHSDSPKNEQICSESPKTEQIHGELSEKSVNSDEFTTKSTFSSLSLSLSNNQCNTPHGVKGGAGGKGDKKPPDKPTPNCTPDDPASYWQPDNDQRINAPEPIPLWQTDWAKTVRIPEDFNEPPTKQPSYGFKRYI